MRIPIQKTYRKIYQKLQIHRTPCAILALTLVAGCSFYNFFSYEENTGLYVFERPSGYGSAEFGKEMVATSTPEVDLLAASAGGGHPTIFYRLAADGDLVDVEDPWREYPSSDDDDPADKTASATSLVGLPIWGAQKTGCIAIGEPAEGFNRVAINCEPGDTEETMIVGLQGMHLFGQQLAAIPPGTGEPWLLAIAGEYDFLVFSSPTDHTDIQFPQQAGGASAGKISELIAGRIRDTGNCPDCFYLAVGTFDERTARYRVFIFVQNGLNSSSIEQVACIERKGEKGFGGVMTTGDLDGDGTDELLISAGQIDGRTEAVYMYDVKDLSESSASIFCDGESPDPLVAIEPSEGPINVKCEDNCFFGTAMTTGDIATDDNGRPELIIGAPRAAVKGNKEAGAVFIYRWADRNDLIDGKTDIAGQIADSFPEKRHLFGGGLAVAPMAGRNELLVAATGKGQIFIAFCTGVGTDLNSGADVTNKESGSVVSTRCRP